MKINTNNLDTKNKSFWKTFRDKINVTRNVDDKKISAVKKIIDSVRKNGDKALIKFINKYDKYKISNLKNIRVTKKEIKEASKLVSKEELVNLKKSIRRIHLFSKKQLTSSWKEKNKNTYFGEKITPIESVGIYVPGGKASYPSTVVMNTIPAKVAGVKKIVMVCPMKDIKKHSLAIVAADLCGVDEIYKIGGAHAIAALTYGTSTIPQVNKIVGPGNIFVTLAKKMVFGEVGIDNIAGPSEIVILADNSANPEWIALDLFSQAEHDELAQSILISTSSTFISLVKQSMEKIIDTLPRKKIILKSIKNRGMFIKTRTMNEASDIANEIAPEHLEIVCKNVNKISKQIKNAGAIFLGKYSTEVFGDYCAGPNHVLPTSGSAKFSSPLGVYDFQKRSSILRISKQTARELSSISSSLAEAEGLQAHGMAARIRKQK
ncbi:MAG: histidinol dehydrogenase [Pseudomonadota bacterium]|nr:histidinol dehydrogenase [Pseudomonadota bacterium]